jgi:acyl-CoA thioesterase-1
MPLKFYLFGDSICFGQLVSPHLTWISGLSMRLTSLAKNTSGILIQNASINGNTTRLALERMSYDVTSHLPDILLIQFGMNDCNYWKTDFGVPRVSHRSFESNLYEITSRAVACGVRKIFIATNHPSLRVDSADQPNISHSKSSREYNNIIRNVSRELQETFSDVVLIDNETYWIKKLSSNSNLTLEQCLLPDGIHLSEAGHRLYDDYASTLICKSLNGFFT